MKELKKYSKIIGGKLIQRHYAGNPLIIKKAGWVEVKEANFHDGFHEIPTIPGGLPKPEAEEEIISEPVTMKPKGKSKK